MYTNNFSGTDPQTYMSNWTCKEMAQKRNKWGGNNMPRWCSPAYDALSAKMSISSAMKDRIRLTKEMNDMLMQDYAMIPLIQDRKSTRLNSSHKPSSYAVFCLKNKTRLTFSP